MDLIEIITELVNPHLAVMGARLADISLSYEEGSHYLHIYVDRIGGTVDLDFIVGLTEVLSPVIDGSSLLPYQYILDIGSAGAEGPINHEDLPAYVNTYVAFILKTAVKGLEKVQGILLGVSEGKALLQINNKGRIQKIEIDIDNIAKARKAIKF